jgi:hypothetical protein
MKKITTFALASVLALQGAYGGPKELTDNLLTNSLPRHSSRTISIKQSSKDINSGSLKLDEARVVAREIEDDVAKTKEKDLSFLLSDASTWAKIYDYGANALSDRDFFEINHQFNTGDAMNVIIRCYGKDMYEFKCLLQYSDGKNASAKIDTAEFNPVIRFFLRLKMRTIIQKGERTYYRIVDDIMNDKEIRIPYEIIKKTFDKFEKEIPEVRKASPKEQGMEAFKRICEIYNKILSESKTDY